MSWKPRERPWKHRDFASQVKRLDDAAQALALLSKEELAELLWWELDRRRLDESGNPISPPGRYEAAAKVVGALLGCVVDGEETLIERIDAVGRGALVVAKDQDTYGPIREIEPLLFAMMKSKTLAEGAKPEALALTFESRWPALKPIDRKKLEKAWRRKSTGDRKLAAVALAVGLLGDRTEEQAYDYVKKRNRLKRSS